MTDILKAIDSRVKPREGESVFAAKCRQHGLDPAETSIHALGCARHGLDPARTSIHALECVRYGLDPARTSANDLTAAGSQLYKN